MHSVCETILDTTLRFSFHGLADGPYLVKMANPGSWYPGSNGAAGADTLKVQNLTGPPAVVWNYP